MPSRRLTFAVGTSLLTASLATAGCAKNTHVNVKPPDGPHVNTVPDDQTGEGQTGEGQTGEDQSEESPDEPPPPDQPRVNVHPSASDE